jgi:hypothetical protein
MSSEWVLDAASEVVTLVPLSVSCDVSEPSSGESFGSRSHRPRRLELCFDLAGGVRGPGKISVTCPIKRVGFSYF